MWPTISWIFSNSQSPGFLFPIPEVAVSTCMCLNTHLFHGEDAEKHFQGAARQQHTCNFQGNPRQERTCPHTSKSTWLSLTHPRDYLQELHPAQMAHHSFGEIPAPMAFGSPRRKLQICPPPLASGVSIQRPRDRPPARQTASIAACSCAFTRVWEVCAQHALVSQTITDHLCSKMVLPASTSTISRRPRRTPSTT